MSSFSINATFREAWKDAGAHVPTLLLTWLTSIVLSIAAVVVYYAIVYFFHLVDGGTGFGAFVGMIFGQISSVPFSLLQSLVGVMFMAIPAVYYQRGKVVEYSEMVSILMSRLGRYILAGILFSLAASIGIVVCVLPGLVVFASLPIYVNKVFTTDLGIWDCFTSSFSAVYGTEKGWALVGIQVLAFLLAFVTCGFCLVGLIVYVPVMTFFIQLYVCRSGLVRSAAA